MFFPQCTGQDDRLIEAPFPQTLDMQGNGDDGIKKMKVHIFKFKTGQEIGEGRSCCDVPSILEPADCVKNDSILGNSGACG